MRHTLALFAATLCLTAAAQTQEHHHAAHPSHGHTAASSLSDGEVRKIDSAQGKLTLRHGPIEHLNMAGMTMVFRVADAQLLAGLKVGDKIRFRAAQIQGALTVTEITPGH